MQKNQRFDRNTYKISETLRQNILVKINIDDEDSFEILGRILHGAEAVWSVDACETVADDSSLCIDSCFVILKTLGQIETSTLSGDDLAGASVQVPVS